MAGARDDDLRGITGTRLFGYHETACRNSRGTPRAPLSKERAASAEKLYGRKGKLSASETQK